MSIHELSDDLHLHLGSFSHEELAQYIPFSEEYTRFDRISPEQEPVTAEGIIATRTADEHRLIWGIYTEKPSVSNFIGTVSLSEVNAGPTDQPEWSSAVQEIHTGLFPSRWHGKGVGTLAKLAVMAYAFEHQDTHTLYAQTSEHNVGAHRSLEKVGFSYLRSHKHFDFSDGGMTQYWQLSHPKVQRYLKDDQAVIAEGWERYQAAHRAVRIEEND